MPNIVAVTGASGHIGANLIRSLLSEGRHVRVLEYLQFKAFEGLNVEIIKGDVRDIKCLNHFFNGADTAYHLAAKIYLGLGSDQETKEVNILGSRNVAQACLKNKVRRLVHFSSIHALSPEPSQEIVDENRILLCDKNAPCYDLSKAAGEKEIYHAIKQGLDAVVVSPCGVIGPFDFAPSPMGKLIREMQHKKFLALCAGGFNWVDVRDVVAAAINAEKKGRKGERYLLSGHWQSLTSLSAMIDEFCSKKSTCIAFPFGLANAISYIVGAYGRLTKTSPSFTPTAVHTLQHYRHVNNEKARRELGFIPRPIKQTIFDALEWYNHNL